MNVLQALGKGIGTKKLQMTVLQALDKGIRTKKLQSTQFGGSSFSLLSLIYPWDGWNHVTVWIPSGEKPLKMHLKTTFIASWKISESRHPAVALKVPPMP